MYTFNIRGGDTWEMESDTPGTMRREILDTYPTITDVAIRDDRGTLVADGLASNGRIIRNFGIIREVRSDV